MTVQDMLDTIAALNMLQRLIEGGPAAPGLGLDEEEEEEAGRGRRLREFQVIALRFRRRFHPDVGSAICCWSDHDIPTRVIGHYHDCSLERGAFSRDFLGAQPFGKFLDKLSDGSENMFCAACVDAYNKRANGMSLSTPESWAWFKYWVLCWNHQDKWQDANDKGELSSAILPLLVARRVHGYLLTQRPPQIKTNPCDGRQPREGEQDVE